MINYWLLTHNIFSIYLQEFMQNLYQSQAFILYISFRTIEYMTNVSDVKIVNEKHN